MANDFGTKDSNPSDTAAKAGSTIGDTAAPYIDKAKGFAKSRPFAAAALVGVIGVALLNTLRGKGGKSA